MSDRRKIVTGLGELLWDLLPSGDRLGGAPANFAVMASRLGDRGIVASRLGDDKRGRQALVALHPLPIDTSFLQSDTAFPTGTVSVSLLHGEPEYTIHEPVAWDQLAFTPEWQSLAQQTDAVCFGSLAQRSAVARATIQSFLASTRPECVRIFDVNLRPPFFSTGVIHASLAAATILKLNESELPRILFLAGLGSFPVADDEADLCKAARLLFDRFPLRLVCITLGARGSLLVSHESHHRHPGVPADLKDAIGAGDAFTAALAHYYLEAAPLPVLNEAGNRWGAWIASHSGAMPALPSEVLAGITQAIRAV
ncbi:PfkB family carbohydrate kinase [Paracidobacterium acidisoli]|uniref:Carbohydrate kinase n=1 Tax=Paracidobacterium acidisoli TaxID=2303751 RepID=A0A372IMR3_9BACT|nr:PfkB family carbohydrate kinase [Paracidobacterium acidisoli]MBT9332490.1 carbohydrate kinase [Paracidobacterium acidisoli]